MKRPITPNQREPIKAEHLRSHAEAIQWLYERVRNIKPKNTPGDSFTPFHPFMLTTWKEGETLKYEVGKGGIQDGTNGDAIDLSAVLEEEEVFTAAGYVVIEADVDEDMVITGWALAIHADAADAEEVGYTTTPPIIQEKIRLLIGKITLDEEDNPTAWQAQFTSARIIYGLQNGVAVKVFEAAPTVAASI